jgi:dTDP-4-dehydrorhamnose reductase
VAFHSELNEHFVDIASDFLGYQYVRILILGANGQVGTQLQHTLSSLGKIKACTRQEANLENLDQLKKLIQNYQPQIIVNAVAYTAVDQAEAEPEKAYRINSEAVATIAQESKKINALLVHYSTDYIFDGTQTEAYTEEDQPNPLSIYGKSKWKGEQLIKESGTEYLIFRTSWVYAPKGKNFVNTILKLAKELTELNIIDDQIGAPTSATLIANITAQAIENKIPKGTYNLTAGGSTSWYGFAEQILKSTIKQQNNNLKLTPVPSEQYLQHASRPKNSKLNTTKLQQALKIILPTWQQELKQTILKTDDC